MTGLCALDVYAWNELDRMLGVWARQTQSGKPMTKDQILEIFGGPSGDHLPILKLFMKELETRKIELKK